MTETEEGLEKSVKRRGERNKKNVGRKTDSEREGGERETERDRWKK
jgi:hypothetical protein